MWTHSLLGDVLKWPPDLFMSPPPPSESKQRTLLSCNYSNSWQGRCLPWPTHIQASRCVVIDSCRTSENARLQFVGMGFVTVLSFHSWNSIPAELGIVTRAITHTSVVIRARLKEGISHVPAPVTHDPLSEARIYAQNHTHFNAACTHVEPVSGRWAWAGLK